MKIRLDDPSLIRDLLAFLRERGCIAYYEADDDAIEALVPSLFGHAEDAELHELLRHWLADHEGAAVEATP